MILDTLAQGDRYAGLHEGFARAFVFLTTTDLASLAPGRHELDGDRMYLSIDHQDGRGRDGARLEAHRDHIDIQLTVDGIEEIGWSPLATCAAAPYDAAKDICFFEGRPHAWFPVPSGTFAIFFPEDAHAPLAGTGRVKKAIVKVRL
jgi:YhcH/YjgK/YiaL family protein